MSTYMTEDRIKAFRGVTASVIERSDTGSEAVDTITQVYSADLHALDARLDAAQEETVHALMDARMRHTMWQQIVTSHSAEAIRSAELRAHLDLTQDIITMVRSLVEVAETEDRTAVSVDDLRAVLARPLPTVDQTLVIGSFVTSQRYTAGTFEHADTKATLTLAFMGWGTVAGRLAATDALQPMFLHEGLTVPRITLERAHGLELVQLV